MTVIQKPSAMAKKIKSAPYFLVMHFPDQKDRKVICHTFKDGIKKAAQTPTCDICGFIDIKTGQIVREYVLLPESASQEFLQTVYNPVLTTRGGRKVKSGGYYLYFPPTASGSNFQNKLQEREKSVKPFKDAVQAVNESNTLSPADKRRARIALRKTMWYQRYGKKRSPSSRGR
ncbi:MAG: hypothetical protein LBU87_03160 [Lactobacillales bacterium]|jgi:hypothetical protein|nr:hypothetical protein [Lactobacillales bacterium]